jgi:hypothetical protein
MSATALTAQPTLETRFVGPQGQNLVHRVRGWSRGSALEPQGSAAAVRPRGTTATALGNVLSVWYARVVKIAPVSSRPPVLTRHLCSVQGHGKNLTIPGRRHPKNIETPPTVYRRDYAGLVRLKFSNPLLAFHSNKNHEIVSSASSRNYG